MNAGKAFAVNAYFKYTWESAKMSNFDFSKIICIIDSARCANLLLKRIKVAIT